MMVSEKKDLVITSIQQSILDSITSLSGDATIQSWISGFVNTLSEKEDEEYSKWETFKIVLRHTLFCFEFWKIVAQHFSDIIILVKCTYDKDCDDALKDDDFVKMIITDPNVVKFTENLENIKDKIIAAVTYIMNLPESDKNRFLDKAFMREIVNFIEKNKANINAKDVNDFIILVARRKFLENKQYIPFIDKSALANDILLNNLEFALKILEVVGKTAEFDKLIAVKKDIIAEFLGNMELNGMSGLMTPESFKAIIEEVLSQEKIGDSCEKIISIIKILKEQKVVISELNKHKGNREEFIAALRQSKILGDDKERFMSEINSAEESQVNTVIERIIGDIDSRYVMRMTQIGFELSQALPKTASVISQEENSRLVYSQCFVVENGRYKLNSIGKLLSSFGFIQLMDSSQQIDNWSIEARKEEDPLEHFDVRQLTERLFSSEGRENTFIIDLIGTVDPDTIGKCIGFLDDLRHDKPPFIWISKILQLAHNDEKLADVLVRHSDKITYFVQNFSKKSLREFGLSEGFIEKTLPILLSDRRNIELSYKLFSSLSSENYPEMVIHIVELIQRNKELRTLLQEPSIHEEIGNLMVNLGDRIPLMKEYFSRFEFQSLENGGIRKLILDFLPTILPLIDTDILGSIDKVMQNNVVPNGVSLGKAGVSVPYSQAKERDEALGNIYMWSIGEKQFSEIEASLKVLGITTEEQLKSVVEETKVNDKAVKVCNSVLGLFKVDDVPAHKTQLKAVTDAIIRAQDKDSLIAGLELAVETGNLSRDNATFLMTVFNESFDGMEFEQAKLLCGRLSYELRIKPFESIGVKRQDGLVVSTIHSDLFFKLYETLSSDTTLREPLTRVALETWIMRSNGILAAEDAKMLSEIIFYEEKVLETLNDLAYRRRSSEVIDGNQDILSSILTSFLASINDEQQRQSFVKIINILVKKIVEDEELRGLVNEIIIKRGKIEPKILAEKADKIFDLIKSFDKDERKLVNSLVIGIIGRSIDNPNALTAIKEALKIIEDPQNDKKSEDIKALAIAVLVNGESLMKHKMGVARALWNGLGAVKAWWSGPVEDKDLVERFRKTVDEERANGNTIDIRGILRGKFQPMSVHALSGQNLGVLDLSNCLFQNVKFVKTDLRNVKFDNSRFTKCRFESAKLPGRIANATFDLESFQSLISTAEKQGLDIGLLLENVKVETNITQPLDGKFIYTMMNFYKSHNEAFSQDRLFEASNFGITTLEILSVDGWRAMGKAFIEETKSLKSAVGIRSKLTENGLTTSLMEKYSRDIVNGKFENYPPADKPFDVVEYIAVKRFFVNGVIVSKTFKQLKDIQSAIAKTPEIRARVETILKIIIQGKFKDRFILSQMDVIFTTLSNGNIFPIIQSLDEDRFQDLCSFIDLYKNRGNIDERISQILPVITNRKYKAFSNIAIILSNNLADKYEWYETLAVQNQEQLVQYGALLASFEKTDPLQDDQSVGEILKSWYINRAASQMKPEKTRNGELTKLECLDIALQYSQDTTDSPTKSRLTKGIIAKFSGNRYLSVPDRTDDLERIYNGINLAPNCISKLAGAEELSAVMIEKAYKALYSVSKREKLALGNFYIPVTINVEQIFADIFSIESITIESIIITRPELASQRAILERLNIDLLNVIESRTEAFMKISGEIAIDASIDSVELTNLLEMSSEQLDLYKIVRTYGIECSPLELKQWEDINPLIFEKVTRYCQYSGKQMNEMLEYKDVLKSIELLSEEIGARGFAKNDCFHLVITLYNQLDSKTRNLLDDNEGRDIIAGIIFKKWTGENLDVETIAKNTAEALAKISPKNGQTLIKLKSKAIEQGTSIAEIVFGNLAIEDEESKKNFGSIVASHIFASGKEVSDIESLVGKNGGSWSKTGLTKAFHDTYSGNLYGYYRVDRKDIKTTAKIFEKLDALLSQNSVGLTA